jgi:hypothetical protein
MVVTVSSATSIGAIGPEHLMGHRVSGCGGKRLLAHDEGNVHHAKGCACREVQGAAQGIDQPEALGVLGTGPAELFAHPGVMRAMPF